MTAYQEASAASPKHDTSWQAHCLAEAIRLREEHWGPLEDADAVRHARLGPEHFETRVLRRAQWLSQHEGLEKLMMRWLHGAGISLAVLALIAAVAGVMTAAGALGDGSRAVNVLWAIGALLGLNTLTFLLWVTTFLFTPKKTTWLGSLWLWVTQKIARGPDATLIPHALMNLLGRAGALRWLFGCISHGLWVIGLSTALVTLLVMLSTASYRFVWATTLLEPDTFVFLTQTLGWLPAQLGFAVPNEAVIRASDNSQVLPGIAQTQWSIWLIGVVVVYGLLPRVLAGVWCLINTRRARQRLHISDTLPGYVALRDRLLPVAQPSGIDRPVDPLFEPKMRSDDPDQTPISAPLNGQPILVSLELAHDPSWPPDTLSERIFDAGNLDSREQRHRLQAALSHNQTPRLLIVCDARQTPDRGTLHLIASLTHQAGQTKVWLFTSDKLGTSGNRLETWRERLIATGMPSTSILQEDDHPLRWLELGDE
jgi:hypothetical protein